jgi:hypothetical protein
MTSRPLRLLVAGLSVAAVLAPSFDAAAKAKRHKPATQYAAGSSGNCRGAGNFRCGAVYNGNDYLGDDPDSFVRLMIQRDLGAKYGGPE